jgi:DNA-directed RNA polymerase subunit alpha
MLPKLSLILKQVRFKRQIEDIDNEAVTISLVKINSTADFQKIYFRFPSLNPELLSVI